MIDTQDIRVDYGDFTAVRDVSLSIEPGSIYGLIGPNGAGKTSLIRVLATLREPTYGEARVAGYDTLEDVAAARRQIGYMPDLAPVHADLTCREFLDFFASAYFIGRRDRLRRVSEVLDLVNLTAKRDVMAGTLSRGMTQRLVLAKTMLHDPSVLLLDEPASGIDPIARVDLRNLLRRLGEEGRTILVSSHILNELSEFCTSVGIMESGHLVVDGTIEEVTAAAGTAGVRHFTVTATGDGAIERVAAVLAGLPGVSAVDAARRTCTFQLVGDDAAAAAILSDLVSGGIAITGYHERKAGVEDVLMAVGSREGEGAAP